MTGGAPAFVPALARAVVRAEVSGAARTIARTAMLDTAACIAAGWTSAQTVGVRHAASTSGAKGAGSLAMALGTAAHALDFDDYEEPGSTHPSAVLVPVILGLAGQREVTIAQAEATYVAGYRAILALGIAMGYEHYMAGWHATHTLGTVGAAVSAARLLDLGEKGTAHAISLAMTQAAGMKAQFGHDAKTVHAGLAARNGIEAASLAAGGLAGASDVFEGDTGFAALYAGRGAAFAGLPEMQAFPPWRKLSPSCGYTLRAIDAACELVARGVDVHQIESVQVEMADAYAKVVPYRAPDTSAQARFSVTWCVAVALMDGQVGVQHFTEAGLTRADLRALEARVALKSYPLPDGAGDMAAEAPDRVAVHLSGGSVLSASCAMPRGAPGRPISEEEFMAKLRACGLDHKTAEHFGMAPGNQVLTAASLLPRQVLEGL